MAEETSESVRFDAHGIALRSGRPDVHRSTMDTGRRLAWVLALLAFGYACYRAYYAAGGTVGMFGEPVSDVEFRAINAVGAAIIFVAAILPPVAVRVPCCAAPYRRSAGSSPSAAAPTRWSTSHCACSASPACTRRCFPPTCGGGTTGGHPTSRTCC